MGNQNMLSVLSRFKQKSAEKYAPFDAVIRRKPSFGGLEIAPGPLAYENGEYVIKDDWNHDSYNSHYGKENGSTYFNFIEMGKLFEKADFSSSDGDIENLLDPFDGWRLPTKTEWEAIITTDAAVREGASVNGDANCHWAAISLTGVSHAGSTGPYGLLLFPDGETITGKALDACDDIEMATSGVTAAELAEYLAQGCVFLPASGDCDEEAHYYSGGNSCLYWSSKQVDENDAYSLHIEDFLYVNLTYWDKYSYYFPCRLVKDYVPENKIDKKYEKPEGGIPETDLASAVQAMLEPLIIEGTESSSAFTEDSGEASLSDAIAAFSAGRKVLLKIGNDLLSVSTLEGGALCAITSNGRVLWSPAVS